MRAIQIVQYFVLAPALLIWAAIKFRQQRRLPRLAVPVYRIYVSPVVLVLFAATVLAVGLLLGIVVPRLSH